MSENAWVDVPSAPGYQLHKLGILRAPTGRTTVLLPPKLAVIERPSGGSTNRSANVLWRECFGDQAAPWTTMSVYTRTRKLEKGDA